MMNGAILAAAYRPVAVSTSYCGVQIGLEGRDPQGLLALTFEI